MNVQKLAWIFAVVFMLLGILGFIPGATNDGMLLGVFMVDTMHNIVHLLSGVVAALCAGASAKASRTYFQVFGIIYAVIAIWGFFMSPALGFIHVNSADNILHVVIAVIALWAGFGMSEEGSRSNA